MLDINLIRDNPNLVKEKVVQRTIDPAVVDQFLALDNRWRELVKKTEELRARLNFLSKERKIEEAKAVKEELKTAEKDLPKIETERETALNKIPNLPQDGWPVGKDETGNKVLREVGKKPNFKFPPQEYLTIAQKLGIIDVERAAKVAGARFGYLFKEAALLEFALIKLVFDKLTKKGFIPVIPPVMIKPEILKGMGRLSGRQKEERYYLPKDDLYLAGSAEHTMGPIHANEILEERDLPRRYVGFSTCFRREAGSYGKDTKGILRVHQFDKVEMFSFTKPENSQKEHQFLLSLQEELMQELKLPYRVVQVCTGDMGWVDAAQYDIETWLPGQNQYRETHSCSNTTDFQARGINVKVQSHYLHMLNGTAFAIGRMIIAIIENYQTKKGIFKIPKALTKYI